MNVADIERAQRFDRLLLQVHDRTGSFPGIRGDAERWCLSCQIVDSLRRVQYAHVLREKAHSPICATPYSGSFDPLKAAVINNRRGELDEAWWLVFLATHFGKHRVDHWSLVQAVYGALNQRGAWTWDTVQQNRQAHLNWLREHYDEFRQFRFSNHRAYRSHKPNSPKGTPAVIESYLDWVGGDGSHVNLVQEAHRSVGQNPKETFDCLYRSMDGVREFGRLGRFDFLTMLGKLGIAPIEPGSAYLWHNATGPLAGARLLFDGRRDGDSRARVLDAQLHSLDAELSVGMQVLEDALCNWQKKPDQYRRFTG